MLLSEIKSGQVIEVLNDGELERYIVCEINGKLEAFNDETTLGKLDYWFDEELCSKEDNVDLLAIYSIIDEDRNVMNAIYDGDCLELVYEVEEECECEECEEIRDLENVIEELLAANRTLRTENYTLKTFLM